MPDLHFHRLRSLQVFADSGERRASHERPPTLHAHPVSGGAPLLSESSGDEDDDSGSEGASSDSEEDIALETGDYGPDTVAHYRKEIVRCGRRLTI